MQQVGGLERALNAVYRESFLLLADFLLNEKSWKTNGEPEIKVKSIVLNAEV